MTRCDLYADLSDVLGDWIDGDDPVTSVEKADIFGMLVHFESGNSFNIKIDEHNS